MEKEEFRRFVKEKRTWYKKIGKVFCPALNEEVIFNAKGFYHLRYDGTGKERSQKEQIDRLRLLSNSVQIIQRAEKIVEYQERLLPSGKTHYWEISGKVNEKISTVILRKVGDGKVCFYSNWQ